MCRYVLNKAPIASPSPSLPYHRINSICRKLRFIDLGLCVSKHNYLKINSACRKLKVH